MQHRHEAIVTQAVLIPVAGHYDKKPRSLDRDVTSIGRARGADLCLEANEISTLHCIIYRTAEGYRLRDCNSRCGTRVNGESVRHALLHDADIVNIGMFSFEFRVPPALFPKDGRIDPAKVEHWKQSRARFAKRALKLRKRVAGGSPHEVEHAQKAHLLKEKIRCYDQRLGELEGAEQELTDERTELAKERESHLQHVQQVEAELAGRLAQADEEIRERWQEFQQRCRAEEVKHGAEDELEKTHATATATATPDADLEQRRERVRQLEDQLTRQQHQLAREQQEFTTMKQQWVHNQEKSSASVEEKQAALAEQEAALHAKKAELMRMMGDLKKMQEDIRKQAKPDVRALHDEVDRLAHENQELRATVEQAQQTPPVHDEVALEDLHLEVKLLNEALEQKELLLQEMQNAAASGDVEPLRAENELLKKLLDEKDREVAELGKQSAEKPKNEGDLEKYETELNEFRRQLETDRGKLNAEVEMLRERNKELDEAVREMEMEMSKERAELARERIRLDRVREEVKADMERMQREIQVRDSMAPVQKLRDELNGKAPPKGEKPLNDRLRSLRGQLADSHPSS